MNQLKLKAYFVESFRGEFPKFLTKPPELKVQQQWSRNVSLFLSKKKKNDFAVKVKISSLTKAKKFRKPLIRFEAIMVGFFRRTEGKVPIRTLAKTTARDMLCEKIDLLFSDVLNKAPLENFKIPLKFK